MAYFAILELLVVALLLYTLWGAIYRLYLSPLAGIPGPKLAILSFWYEFYYDIVLKGRYQWKLVELHEEYGPIIRINPLEVHINDPDFYDELYVHGGKRKTELWSWTVPMFGTPNSILATIDHDVHRRRRNAYSNFFSKQSIRRYSNVIQSSLDRLCSRLRDYQSRGEKVNLMHAWTAFTGDVVTEYSFPKSYGLLDQPSFAPDYYNLWVSILSNCHLLKQFPFIFPMLSTLPIWFVDRYVPDLAVSYRWHRQWRQQILDIKSGTDESAARRGKPSIFETLLDSDLPPHDKSISRLIDDAQTLVGAGSTTTSLALALATYYIITDQRILDTLSDELTTIIPDATVNAPLADLEKLPYLTAIIYEAFRISYGVSHRLQRVCPDQAIRYYDYILPSGTPVSMSTMLIHDNPAVFPNPRTFKPERWLPLEAEGARLHKYFVAFSRGSRQCLGMHLGYAELYIGLAGVFRRFGRDMRIVETIEERDVEFKHDMFTPSMSNKSKGIMMVLNVQ